MEEDVVTIDLNPRERRLYDRVRAALASAQPVGRSGIADVLMLFPDLTVLLARLLRDRRVPMGSKLIALVGLGYVLSPLDLLPALLFGPLGWLDDALVVTAALSRILNDVHPDIVRSHWSGKGDALVAIQRVAGWSRGLVGGRVRDVVRVAVR